jgi:heat shock protein HtpX
MNRILLFIIISIAILLTVSVVLSLIGFTGIYEQNGIDLDYNSLMIFCLVWGMVGSFISLYLSKWTAKRMGIQIIKQPSNEFEKWYVSIVEKHAKILDMKIPEIGILPSDAPNAFATGASRNSSLVVLSTGLVNKMNRNEVEAVIGHEMSHASNGDMVTLALIQGIVNSFVFFFAFVVAHFISRVIFRDSRGGGFWIQFFIRQFLIVFFSILASPIIFWFSRRREFRADFGGAQLAGKQNMISALNVLQKNTAAKLPDQMVAFGISNKGQSSTLKKLFSTHPPLSERIVALQDAEIVSLSEQQIS